MRLLTLIAAVLLLTGEALAQELFSGRIQGTVVTGSNTVRPLGEVAWSVEAQGKLVSGKVDTSGRFEIDLPALFPDWKAEAGKHLAVNFSKQGYEQVIWVLDCASVGQAECRDLKVKLTPLPGGRVGDKSIALDPDEIDTLDRYYRRTGRTLYLLPYSVAVPASGKTVEDVAPVLLETFHSNIIDHLQTLPVIPPPQNITPPTDIGLQPLNKVRVTLMDTEKIQLYGDYLNALAIIGGAGSVQRDAAGNEVVRVRFHYQTIPFQEKFAPIREVVSFTAPAAELNFPELYEKVSARWGLYTLLALSVREVREFERTKPAGDRTKLERVRAYLVAERSQLRSDEPLKMQHIQKLLDLVDEKLGVRQLLWKTPHDQGLKR
jgi:hypothetical protein